MTLLENLRTVFESPGWLSRTARVAIPTLAVGLAALLNATARPALGDQNCLLFYFPAVALAGVAGGWRYGIALILLSLAAVHLDPGSYHTHAMAVEEVVFVAVSGLTLFLAEAFRRVWAECFTGSAGSLVGQLHHEVFPDLPQKWKEAHARGLAGETVSAKKDPLIIAGELTWPRWLLRP